MLDKIVDFLNKNPILGLVIIFVALYVLWLLYAESCEEGFDSVSGTESKQLDSMFKENYEGKTKMVNFKCKGSDGKNYYMVNMKISSCENINTAQDIDCGENVLVLMEESELQEKLKQYESSLAVQHKVCNATNKIKCEAAKEQNCDRDYLECNISRQFTHDFEVSEFIKTNPKAGERRKYIIKGVSMPKTEGSVHSPVKLSKNLYTDKKSPLCGDFGSDVEDTKLMVVEKINDTRGGIIGGLTDHITVKLMFETPVLGQDKRPMFADGAMKMKTLYISACDTKCKSGGIEYTRLCLTDNDIDPAILDFEPILV